MPKIVWSKVPDSTDFSLLPIGRYPARLEVDAYQKDQYGTPMTGADGLPRPRQTQAGDEMWNLTWHILAPGLTDRHVLDSLNFTPGGQKRVKVLYVRGGFAAGTEEEEMNLEPEDIHGSYWWIEVEHPDPASSLRQGAALKESKYTFKAGHCACDTCTKYNGQKVNVYARVPFAGMYPMAAEDMAKFLPGAATPGLLLNGLDSEHAAGVCGECVGGQHWHKAGAGECKCENESHVPF